MKTLYLLLLALVLAACSGEAKIDIAADSTVVDTVVAVDTTGTTGPAVVDFSADTLDAEDYAKGK